MTVSFFGRYKTRLHLCDYPRVESKFQSALNEHFQRLLPFRWKQKRKVCNFYVFETFIPSNFMKLLEASPPMSKGTVR
jgi:hypothetical protein